MKRMKKKTGILVLVILAVIIGFLGWYTSGVLTNTIKGNQKGLKLGLDLAGGVSITYEADKAHPSTQDMEDTIQKLQSRIENDLSDKASTTEANVYKIGDNRIGVEIPGVKDANAILDELGTPGNLYFIRQKDANGSENYTYDSTKKAYALAEGKTIEGLIKSGDVILTGTDVKTAKAGYKQDSTTNNNEPAVSVTFKKSGATKFGEATTTAAASNQTIGIYYDGKFVSVPSVNEPITGGSCEISGNNGSMSIEDAKQLASYIRIGGLKLNLKEVSSQVVSASLGGNALKTSLIAAGVGLIIIMIFLMIAYRMLGVSASIALALYTELIIAILDQFDITLTLPGIAGIILSIGMAVDANSIIFARIKEEIGTGHTVASAIEAGFHKALSAIIDGNVTTLIAAAVLGLIGTGTVKGFAITLALGVVLSMFTALFISKTLVRSFYAIGVRNEKFYGKRVLGDAKKFIEKRVIFFTVSLAVIAAGIIGMVAYKVTTKKALNYSLEFSGGTSTTIAVDKDYTLAQVEKEISPLFRQITGDADVQAQVLSTDHAVLLKTRTLSLKEREQLNALLKDKLGVKESSITSENISSTISGEMRRTSLIAVIVAVILMLIYIWFRFRDVRFGGAAVIALAHDVLVTLAVYAVFRLSVGSSFIACILTIIGYSINDTIVIFDRIRDNKKLRRGSLEDTIDFSLNQTLNRTIMTSLTTLVVMIPLLVMVSSAISQFIVPLMVGVIVGCYSSIFVCAPLYYDMNKKDEMSKYMLKQQEKAKTEKKAKSRAERKGKK